MAVLPETAIQLVLTTDRTAVGKLLSMSKFTDMSFWITAKTTRCG